MIVDSLVNSDALPALEAATKFAARRHSVIAHNIANFSTPNYQPRDVSVPEFQAALGQAIDARREKFGGTRGEFNFKGSSEVRVERDGRGEMHFRLEPTKPSGNVLFHDRNDRDLERTMQALVENTASFRIATDLYRTQMGLLRSAIRLQA